MCSIKGLKFIYFLWTKRKQHELSVIRSPHNSIHCQGLIANGSQHTGGVGGWLLSEFTVKPYRSCVKQNPLISMSTDTSIDMSNDARLTLGRHFIDTQNCEYQSTRRSRVQVVGLTDMLAPRQWILHQYLTDALPILSHHFANTKPIVSCNCILCCYCCIFFFFFLLLM